MDDDEAPGSESDDFDPVLALIARADARPLLGGTLAGRFRLLSVAGRGGFGTVYRARDERSGAAVALKVMRHGTTDAARFEREAELLASLHHPSVVSHVAHGATDDGAPFLAMEWLDGIDLARMLELGRVPVQNALTIALCAAEGLAAAHALGAIHRDIKPSNLYLVGCSADDVRLIDFGVARTPHSAASLTTTGAVLGTPAYMAPEQARGARDISPAADVFALGCVLFECLSGVAPFAERSAAAQVARQLAGSARLSERWPEAPPELDALLASMLAPRAEERVPDGAAAVDALGRVLGGRAAERPLRAFTTVVAHTAPWRTFPSTSLALVSSLGGEVVETGAGVMVARFVSDSPEEAANLASRLAAALVSDDGALRVAVASSRARKAPPVAAIKRQLSPALAENPDRA